MQRAYSMVEEGLGLRLVLEGKLVARRERLLFVREGLLLVRIGLLAMYPL